MLTGLRLGPGGEVMAGAGSVMTLSPPTTPPGRQDQDVTSRSSEFWAFSSVWVRVVACEPPVPVRREPLPSKPDAGQEFAEGGAAFSSTVRRAGR